MGNPGTASGKMMMEEDELEEARVAEQLHDFLTDASHVLRGPSAPDASAQQATGSGASRVVDDDLHLLLPALSEFVAACCTCALSYEQRVFVTALVEAASTRLLHCATSALPGDVSTALAASRHFLECSLCSLEHACADSLGMHRSSGLQIARRALASILALTTDVEPDANLLASALETSSAAQDSFSPPPRFDELLGSPSLQAALAQRQAAAGATAANDTAASDAGGGAATDALDDVLLPCGHGLWQLIVVVPLFVRSEHRHEKVARRRSASRR